MQLNQSMHQMNMKYTIAFFIAILGLSNLANAQKSIRLYGYEQAVTKGMAGRERDENGKIITKAPAQLYNYFMYITSTNKNRIYPAELWIKGQKLGVKAEAVNTTPVTMLQDDGTTNAAKIVLVPKTTAKVFHLTGTTTPSPKEFGKAKKLAEANELVVVYKLNGKFQYATLKKFAALSSAALQ